MEKPEDNAANEADDAAVDPAAPGPALTGAGPYPELLHHQLLTPRAPLPPGAGIGVYPGVMHVHQSTEPARWATDPRGRHEWRWWNGRIWTEHVADDGEASIDPLD